MAASPSRCRIGADPECGAHPGEFAVPGCLPKQLSRLRFPPRRETWRRSPPPFTLVEYATAAGRTTSDHYPRQRPLYSGTAQGDERAGTAHRRGVQARADSCARESQDSPDAMGSLVAEGSFYFVGIAGQQSVSPPSTSSPAQSLVPPSTSSPAQSLVPTVIGTWRWFNPNSSIVHIRPDGITIHLANGIRVDAGTWTASANRSIRIHGSPGGLIGGGCLQTGVL